MTERVEADQRQQGGQRDDFVMGKWERGRERERAAEGKSGKGMRLNAVSRGREDGEKFWRAK